MSQTTAPGGSSPGTFVAAPRPPKTNTLALVGFIASFVIPLAGLIVGILAMRELRAPECRDTGRGLARWAMIIGAIGTAGQTLFFLLWLSLFFQAAGGISIG